MAAMIRYALSCLLLALSLSLHAAGFTPLDRAGAGRLFDASTYRQATIVTLWSADCSHCKTNLQHLAELLKKRKDLRLVTLAVEPESAALGPILERYKLPGERYVYAHDNPEAIAYAIDPEWAGELPRTYFFDGKGGKKKLSGVISSQMLETAILQKPR